MELEINLKEGERIKKLEDEISDLKQKLEVAKFHPQSDSFYSEKFPELFGVIDSDFNLLSVNDELDHSLAKPQNKLKENKCYTVFCGRTESCVGCSISTDDKTKLAWYFLQPQLSDKKGPCNASIISPVNHIAPFELTLKETDLFYEQLFESTGDALVIVDCKGRILKFTRKLAEMLSYSDEEFSTLTIYDIDDPINSLTFDERVLQVKREKGAVFETDLIDRSGKLIPVECSSSPIKYHNKFVFFVTMRNIEKRKMAQKELLESEIRFRSLVENATDLVMRFDREYRHVFANSASLQVLGIPPQNFIGKTHLEMGFPEELCIRWEDAMARVFDTGLSEVSDFSVPVKGNDIYFEWQLIPEFDSEGEIPFLLAVARNVTKRKLSERDLEEALKTKDKFFSIIAHDLRNPFGSLRTLSECLQNDDSLSREEVKEFAEIIHTSACQGYDLLENLLEWSRSQRGNINWQPQEFDLVEVVNANINLIQANIHKKRIHLTFHADKSRFVFADKYMIDTVIRNLLANAVKFTYANGNIEISIDEQENHFCISVKDNGKGITIENQTNLFDLDNQYSSVGTAMETGTGLGLIMCKEFTDANNGDIWVESEEGNGSCFSFTVPKK